MDKPAARENTAAYIENPITTTENCRYCLMCRHVCPVGNLTHSETLTPHGWGLIIASIRRKLLNWEQQTADVLYKCADCGLCQSNCVTDQPLPSAIAAARAEVVELGLAPPEVLALDRFLQKWSNPYVEQLPEKVSATGEIGLFVGDAAQHLSPGTVEAAIKVLKEVGVEPVLVGVGHSSGFLASSLGLRSTAIELAKAVVDEIKQAGCGKLFVLTPGDLYTFKTLYLERLNLPWPNKIEVVETTSFLYKALKSGELSLKVRNGTAAYAYHDPCHSPRAHRDHEAPRKLLAQVLGTPPLEMFWREQRAHPCGAVGGLERTQPDLARGLADARLDDARKAGASLLITEDPLCLNQLQKHAPSGIEVRGLYETLTH